MLAALLTWQSGVLVATLGLCAVFHRQRPSRHALLALLCYALSVCLFNAWVFVPSDPDPERNQWLLDFAYKVFNAGINGALCVYLGALFYFLFDPPDQEDLTAKAVWLVVLTAETFSLLVNNITCNLIAEVASREELAVIWGTTAERYVCAREFGAWLEWAPIAIEVGLLTWIIHAHKRVSDSGDGPDGGIHITWS